MTPYNMAFACFTCQKSFKKSLGKAPPNKYPSQLTCPNCGEIAYNMGRHFKPPKKNDKKQWEKVRFLFDHGFRFQKIRVGNQYPDSVPYPETLEEARKFVIKYQAYSERKNEI